MFIKMLNFQSIKKVIKLKLIIDIFKNIENHLILFELVADGIVVDERRPRLFTPARNKTCNNPFLSYSFSNYLEYFINVYLYSKAIRL